MTSDKTVRLGSARLPLAVIRRTILRPRAGSKPACIDLQIRVPIDDAGIALAALPFLARSASGHGGVAMTLGRARATAEEIEAVRRP